MAYEHRRTAGQLELDAGSVAWWGRARDEVVAATGELAGDLRAEAAALAATADLLDAAARAAEQRDGDLAARARAEEAAATAEPCPPARGGPTVSARPGSQPPRRRSTAVGGRVR